MEQIRQRVVDAGGVLVVTMEELREAHGSGRLKHLVLDAIRRGLEAVGLRWLPVGDLPADQRQTIILYLPQTRAGQLIELAIWAAGQEAIADRREEPDAA